MTKKHSLSINAPLNVSVIFTVPSTESLKYTHHCYTVCKVKVENWYTQDCIPFILIHSGKKQELFKEREGRGLFSHSHERGWREERERRAGFEGTARWSSTAPVTQIWASGPKTFRAQAHLSATVLREKSIDLSIIRLGIASCAHRWDYSSLSTCRGLWWQILFSPPSNRKQCRKMEEAVVFICLPLFIYV